MLNTKKTSLNTLNILAKGIASGRGRSSYFALLAYLATLAALVLR